jgi:Winged helix-turn-helix DNA-binding
MNKGVQYRELCMSDFSKRIVDILEASPNGLTSKDVAAHLGVAAGNISSRLSKLAAYGVIGRARRRVGCAGTRATVYEALRPSQSEDWLWISAALSTVHRSEIAITSEAMSGIRGTTGWRVGFVLSVAVRPDHERPTGELGTLWPNFTLAWAPSESCRQYRTKLMASDTERWARVVKVAGIRPEWPYAGMTFQRKHRSSAIAR